MRNAFVCPLNEATWKSSSSFELIPTWKIRNFILDKFLAWSVVKFYDEYAFNFISILNFSSSKLLPNNWKANNGVISCMSHLVCSTSPYYLINIMSGNCSFGFLEGESNLKTAIPIGYKTITWNKSNCLWHADEFV